MNNTFRRYKEKPHIFMVGKNYWMLVVGEGDNFVFTEGETPKEAYLKWKEANGG